MRKIIEAPQPLVLSFFGDYTECGGTKYSIVGDG